MQIAWLAASLAVVGALCWGGGRLLGLVIGRRSPYWRTLLPWFLGQAYLALGLLSAPAPPAGGMLRAAAVTGVLTLAAAAVGRRPAYPRARALLFAWAVPWAAATVLSLF